MRAGVPLAQFLDLDVRLVLRLSGIPFIVVYWVVG